MFWKMLVDIEYSYFITVWKEHILDFQLVQAMRHSSFLLVFIIYTYNRSSFQQKIYFWFKVNDCIHITVHFFGQIKKYIFKFFQNV